jgi:hypothetical protein
MKLITKMLIIKYSTKGNHIKIEKTRFGKVNPENDVIHDAKEVIWDINLKKSRRYWASDIGPAILGQRYCPPL